MWLYIGIILFVWIFYDLFTGVVWSYREIKRSEEPGQYWLWMAVWTVIALASFVPSVSDWLQ